jgi:hypothetical protein
MFEQYTKTGKYRFFPGSFRLIITIRRILTKAAQKCDSISQQSTNQ